MEGSRGQRRTGIVLGVALALAAAGCGGGGERQDENEPEGSFRVAVDAAFPSEQKLAKRSKLRVTVTNVDSKTIPNVAVTVSGFDRAKDAPGLADRSRPVFVINGAPAEIGGLPESKPLAPEGGETAYVDTWALGELGPNKTAAFEWDVTAVQAGDFRVTYTVSAGLDGKAKAVLANGQPPKGVFVGTVDDRPPDARVADDGRTVIREDR